MVEWMELKTYLAPLFIKEIDSVSERYLSKCLSLTNPTPSISNQSSHKRNKRN